MRLVFIIGPHRTGTKSYAHFFKEHYPETNSFHQFSSLRLVNIFSNLLLSGIISESLYQFVLRKTLIRHIRSNSDKPYYIVSNGFNFLAAKYIAKEFDDVRIVHAVRDPVMFVKSYLNFIDGRLKSKIANNFLPYWHFPGFRTKEFTKSEWRNLSRIQKYAWYWKFKNDWIENEYGSDDKYYRIRLEDLRDYVTRTRVIQELIEFLDLKFNESVLSFFDTKYNMSSKKIEDVSWDMDITAEIDDIVKDTARRYGYPVNMDGI